MILKNWPLLALIASFGVFAYGGTARVLDVNNLNGLPSITITNGGGTVLLPTVSTTLVGKQTTDELSAKTLSLTSNTITSTASRVAEFGAGGELAASSTVDTTELGFLDGLTSGILSVSNTSPAYNKTFSLTSNTITSTASRVAEFSATGELEASPVIDLNEINKLDGLGSLAVGVNDNQTLINKNVSIASNTLTGTASRALVTDASGVVSVTLSLPTSLGGTSSTSVTGAFNNLSPATTKGDLIVHDGGSNVRFPVGSDGQVLTASSASTTGVTFATPTAAPTFTPTRVIYAGGSNELTSSDQFKWTGNTLELKGGNTTPGTVTNPLLLRSGSTMGTATEAIYLDFGINTGATVIGRIESVYTGSGYIDLRAHVFSNNVLTERLRLSSTGTLATPSKLYDAWDVTGVLTAVTKEYNLSTTGGPGWSQTRGVGTKYKTDDGTWRLKFNITGTCTSAARTSFGVTITNVTFISGGFNQALSVATNSTTTSIMAYTTSGTGGIEIYHVLGTTDTYHISGDVELDSEPSL